MRDVPLLSQLVELGFPTFSEATPNERLFFVPYVEGGIAGLSEP